MLSAIHPATVAIMAKVDRNTNMAIVKSNCVVDYCKKMGGVDLSDQIGQYSTCLCKTSKWYKRLFFHLLHVVVISSYILYKKVVPGVANQRSTHLSSPRPKLVRWKASMLGTSNKLTARHFPEYILATPGAKRKRPSRNCEGCNPVKSKRTGWKRKQTSFWCSNSQKPLCIPECIHVYHTVQNY